METHVQMEKEHVKLPTKNNLVMYPWKWGFLGGAMVKKKKKKSVCQCRWHKIRQIPWSGDTKIRQTRSGDTKSGRSPGTGNGNVLQDSCLENSTYRGAWWVTVDGVAKSQTQLSTQHIHENRYWWLSNYYDFIRVLVKNDIAVLF